MPLSSIFSFSTMFSTISKIEIITLEHLICHLEKSCGVGQSRNKSLDKEEGEDRDFHISFFFFFFVFLGGRGDGFYAPTTKLTGYMYIFLQLLICLSDYLFNRLSVCNKLNLQTKHFPVPSKLFKF